MTMRFYVYILRRPDGRPFYVGMGSGRRVLVHEELARTGDTSEKSHVIRKVWASGGEVRREIVARFGTDLEAKAHEVSLIAEIGRKDLGAGPLVNRTGGGDGVTSLSPEMKRLHAQRTREGMARPEVKAACRQHIERLRSDPVTRAKLARSKEYWADPLNRAAQSERTKRFNEIHPEAAARAIAVRKLAVATPEARAKMRAAKLGKKQSAETIAKRAAALKKAVRPADIGQRIAAGKLNAKMNRLANALL